MTAARYDLTIEKGATFSHEFVWKDKNGQPINLTGATAKMQIRSYADGELFFEASTANGKLSIDEAAGKISLFVSAQETESFEDWRFGKYDIEVTNAALNVTRLIQGLVEVSQEVTK
jgi:hypothetical protein